MESISSLQQLPRSTISRYPKISWTEISCNLMPGTFFVERSKI